MGDNGFTTQLAKGKFIGGADNGQIGRFSGSSPSKMI
jgi:hypothetical protein